MHKSQLDYIEWHFLNLDKNRRSAKDKEVVSEPVEEDPNSKLQWTTTFPTGERICTRLDGLKQEVRDVPICTASDPQTNEVR